MAEITGRIVGAYRDEPGFILDDNGIPVSITDILNMILTGGAEADGNGIYSGSGNVPADTIATALGKFTIRSIGQELLLGDDQGTFQSFLNKLANGTWGFRVGDSVDGLECDLQVSKTGLFVETDSSIADGVTTIVTTKDEAYISANNESGNIVILRISPKTVRMTGIPNYANDAAADADADLLSGGLYTVTGSRALNKKP